MNILPFVFAIFAIFTFLSSSLLKEAKQTGILLNRLENFYHLQQKYYNNTAGLSYKSQTKQQPASTSSTIIRNKKYTSPRLLEAVKGSQLNLYPLIQENEPKTHPFYAIIARLLCLLYPNILPDQQSACALLDTILAKAKTLKEPSLNQLMPEDPLFQESYYRMLKGTNQYDLVQKKGIPPLADFLMIHKKNSCCYLCSAHFLVLQAIFGENFAHIIIEGEQQKWESGKAKVFNRKEIESLITQHPKQAAIYTTIKKYCRAHLDTKNTITKKSHNQMSFSKAS